VNHPSVLPLRHCQEPSSGDFRSKDQSPCGEDAWSPKWGLVPAKPVYRIPILRAAHMPARQRLGTPGGLRTDTNETESLVQSSVKSTESNALARGVSASWTQAKSRVSYNTRRRPHFPFDKRTRLHQCRCGRLIERLSLPVSHHNLKLNSSMCASSQAWYALLKNTEASGTPSACLDDKGERTSCDCSKASTNAIRAASIRTVARHIAIDESNGG